MPHVLEAKATPMLELMLLRHWLYARKLERSRESDINDYGRVRERNEILEYVDTLLLRYDEMSLREAGYDAP